MLSIKRILCPTDFSEPSRRAIDVAGDLALHLGAEVCVLHVVSAGQVPASAFELMYPVPRDVLLKDAEEQLRPIVRDLVTRGVRATPLVANGDAGHEIVRAAREQGFDLIVVAAQGQGMVEHLLVGSVAERVVRLAGCPVLSIPTRRDRHAPAPTL